MIIKKSFILSAITSLALLSGVTSCKSSDDESGNQITNTNVVNDDASAISLVNGVYAHGQPLSSSFSSIIELNSNK